MDLTAQLYFLWLLVLSNGHYLDQGPREFRDPGVPDLLDPLNLGLFGPDRPAPGMFDRPHSHHGLPGRLEILGPPPVPLLVPPIQNTGKGGHQKSYHLKVTTESTPLKINLMPEENSKNITEYVNNKSHKNDTVVEFAKKGNGILSGNNSSEPVKNITPPTIPIKDLPTPILRTNENKTTVDTTTNKEILKLEGTTIKPDNLNSTEDAHSADAIVFPDNVDEMKSRFKEVSDNVNKSCNQNNTSHGAKQDVTNKSNYTKNMDAVLIPVQAFTLNPMKNINEGIQNQALPITNNVFPNRPAVYTIVNPGQKSLYTNIVNTIPQNVGQPQYAVLNNGNNYYQSPAVSQTPLYNTAVNYPNNNPNFDVVNSYTPSNNVPLNSGNTMVSPNSVGTPITMTVNPNIQQPQTPNGFSNQLNNGQQQNLYPNNGIVQQPGVTPNTYNVQGNIPQNSGFNNINGNNAQTFVPVNIGTNNNIQPNANAQQFYILTNNNQPNSNMNGLVQPMVLNSQGSAMNSNPSNVLPDNTQKYILVNANQQTQQQNGQGSNLYTIQNGQLVALVPVQIPNNGVVNNGNSQIPQINNNVMQPTTYVQNPQSKLVTINTNTNQPNILLGNMANSPIILSSQISNLNGQNTGVNNPILNGQISNLNGQNNMVNGPILLTQPNSQNVINPASQIVNLDSNGQNGLANGGNLYTVLSVPNNYASSNFVQPSPVNLVNLKDKADKGHSGTVENSVT